MRMLKLRRRTPWLALLSAGAITLTGCSKENADKADLGATTETTATIVAREDVPTTGVQLIKRARSVRLTGDLQADEESEVASKRGGIVREIVVERGDLVKAGDALLTLDTIDAEQRLEESRAQAAELAVRLGLKSPEDKFDAAKQPDVESAKARFDLAEANFKRDTELLERKVIARTDFDRTQNEYDTARQQFQLSLQQAKQLYQSYQTALVRLKTAQQNLDDMVVRAPFDGLVSEKLTATGQSLRDGDRVIRLVRIQPLRLRLTIPEQYVAMVKEGMMVDFTVAAFPGEHFKARVKHVSPNVEANTRSLVVEAVAENEDGRLRPGFFASAELLSSDTRTAMVVPRSAVQRSSEVAKVFVLEDGVARERVVSIGDLLSEGIEITSGLKGDEIIIADASKVSEGIVIR